MCSITQGRLRAFESGASAVKRHQVRPDWRIAVFNMQSDRLEAGIDLLRVLAALLACRIEGQAIAKFASKVAEGRKVHLEAAEKSKASLGQVRFRQSNVRVTYCSRTGS